MSLFRVALQREAERRQLTQSDLARQSGLSRSYISRLLAGEKADLSDDNFVAILGIFSADKGAQAGLVAARCMDARIGPGAERVEITLKDISNPEHGLIKVPHVNLSQETENAFAWLRSQCPVNKDLEKHLLGYARLLGMK
jgi:transcriptional regulator with XRE-family HTH domain